jgi:hypothetical protein
MKTKINISNLKKLAVSACSALVITTGSYTQPNPDINKNEELVSMVRLEALMNSVEQTVRFVAPSVSDTYVYEKPEVSDEIEKAYENLEMLADLTEAVIKYKAPAVEDAEKVSPELERLDILANAIEESIRFKAPSVNELPESDYITNNSSEIMLANETRESNESFGILGQTEKPVYLIDKSMNPFAHVSYYTRNTNGSVVQVGFYQVSKVSVWSKVWRLLTSKTANRKKLGIKTIAAAYTMNVDEKKF